MDVVAEDQPLVVAVESAEEEPDTDPLDASDHPTGAQAAPPFDIDDRGRRVARLALNDGTGIQMIQETFVDWRSGGTVAVALKGWLNRRRNDGTMPANSYYMSMQHVLGLQTRKLGRTNPPIDFSPMSDGSAGFYVTHASLSSGVFTSEAAGGRSNSLALHYIGAWLITAAGEPRDNPIDRIHAHLTLNYGGRSYVTGRYAAQRGGQ